MQPQLKPRYTLDEYFDDEKFWLIQEVNEINDKLHLPSLDCELDLNDVYQAVEFQPDPETIRLLSFVE